MKETQNITLRKTEVSDLEALFTYQADEDAAWMAAFVNEQYRDKDAYLAKWNRLLGDPTVNTYAILLDGHVIGSVGTWVMNDEPQITYGLGKEFWGKGIATEALRQFLVLNPVRPLFGRAAADNVGSIKILEKCGFRKTGEDTGYAHARGKEIVEVLFVLEA